MILNNLELIIGPVCSGKSAELIRRIDRYSIAGYNVLVVKPKIDTRTSSYIKSRNNTKMFCLELEKANSVYDQLMDFSIENGKDIHVVAFDEAQFFEDIYEVVKDLILKKFKVLVSALDSDFKGLPFGNIPKLVTISNSVTKLCAICMGCKNDTAIFSQKLKRGGSQIEIGDLELYQPRCINCFVPGGIQDSLEEDQ